MLEPGRKNNPNTRISVDPPKPARVLISFILTRISDPKRAQKRRDKSEAARQASGARHKISYFHQLNDPYSHLSVQRLKALSTAYDIDIVPHLINAAGGKNQPYPEALSIYARRDAAAVAPHYGLTFPGNAGTLPSDEAEQRATRILASLSDKDFIDTAAQVNDALWQNDIKKLEMLEVELGSVSENEAARQLAAGTELLKKLGHYSGATFLYAGEWFWGIDRLYHLEARLNERNANREGTIPIAPRPPIDAGSIKDTGTLTLEFFSSLRSPYTAIIFDKTCKLADETGINLVLRPVLPMVMRGVPATPAKGKYIFSDTKREAEALGVEFGPVYDPIGEPVRQAYSLFPWATNQGKGRELLSAFLDAAFRKAIHVDSKRGMKKIVQNAGLSWRDARKYLGTDTWKTEITENQRVMTEELGLWGVPSFRLSGPADEPDFTAWGQDRLWLVAAEIKRRLELSKLR